MSHLDELDEFEAELELGLKREYTAVFGLFRYCVLTQDATYLCNKLDLAQVSQPNYPFFHLKLEDVWVWDKNRPTRIIAAELLDRHVAGSVDLGPRDDPRQGRRARTDRGGASREDRRTASVGRRPLANARELRLDRG